MKNPILKFVAKNKKEDVVHTSVFSEAQNKNSFGATSTQSFSDRMKIQQNRQKIKEYSDSQIVTQAYAASGVRAKTYTPPEKRDSFLSKDSRVNPSIRSTTPINTPTPHVSTNFRPPVRKSPGISKKI